LKTIGPADVKRAFQEAIKRLGASCAGLADLPLSQPSVKYVVYLALDILVGEIHGSDPAVYLCARGSKAVAPVLLNTKPCSDEYMLDVVVLRGEKDPLTTLATAESEAFEEHGICEYSSSNECDYLWDLFKLLHFPSPLRLFFARVRGPRRCELLEGKIEDFVRGYYEETFRNGDRFFSAVLPTRSEEYGKIRWRGWVSNNGKLKSLGEEPGLAC
jgi:hypothetical protein